MKGSVSESTLKKLTSLMEYKDESHVWAARGYQKVRNKQKERYFMVTTIGFYIFQYNKNNEDIKVHSVKSLVTFKEAGFNKYNDVIAKFEARESTVHMIIEKPNDFMKAIYVQHDILLWSTIPQVVPGFSNPEIKTPVDSIKERPHEIMTLRYLAFCMSRDVEVDKKLLVRIKEFDEDPEDVFVLPQMETENFAPAMLAILLEPLINNIVFDNFCSNNIGFPLCFVFANPSKIKQITLKNYNEVSTFTKLKAKRHSYNQLSQINIVECNEKFIIDFLEATIPLSFTIDVFRFRNCEFTPSFTSKFLKAIENYQVFSNLASLEFVRCSVTIESFRTFGRDIIKGAPSLKNLTLKDDSLDVCGFLDDIFKTGFKTQSLCLTDNEATNLFEFNDPPPEDLLFLDVSNCKWVSESLKNFFTGITRKERQNPLSLWIENVDFEDSISGWEEMIASMDFSIMKVAITEINLSHNSFSVSAFEAILNLLNTQFPIFSKVTTRLRYLALSYCFSEADVEACLKKLWEFLSMRDLWGLEIRGNIKKDQSKFLGDFISQCVSLDGFTAIDLYDNIIDKDTALEILQFVHDSKSIAEICVDQMGLESKDDIIWFYQSLVMSSHILAINKPIDDMEKYMKEPELKRFAKKLRMKRDVCSFSQRISLFLSLAGDYSTRFVSVTDNNIRSNDQKDSYQLLRDAHFINPTPNLFTVLSQQKYDNVEVHPLASLVTEYVATSGKYGIFPPTEPPTDQPRKPLVLNPIYASVPPVEDQEIGDIQAAIQNADLRSISSSISSAISNEIKEMKKKINWLDPKQTASIPPTKI